jgi:hypothetical protein
MKSKIIITLTILITLAVTSADAQSAKGRREYQKDGINKNYGYNKGKISKHDRHRLARERHEYRRDKHFGRNESRYSYHQKRYQRHDNRKNGRYGYDYRNKQRRFD